MQTSVHTKMSPICTLNNSIQEDLIKLTQTKQFQNQEGEERKKPSSAGRRGLQVTNGNRNQTLAYNILSDLFSAELID